MHRSKLPVRLLLIIAALFAFGVTQHIAAQSKGTRTRDDEAAKARQITHADRVAAAARRAAARRASPVTTAKQSPSALAPLFPAGMRPGGVPDYFNVGNYANSPLPVLDATGSVVPGTGIRKFVDSLPGLTSANKNNLGQYLPIAVKDTTTYPGSDYYQIGLSDYIQVMHSDLPAGTRLRGYRDLAATGADGANHYLGPVIIAQRGRPVRIKFTNELGIGAAGNLFIPVDPTVMGAGLGPDGVHSYTENRAVIHLHGGHTPWISDGTPHQWITPAGENTTPYLQGASLVNVPDMGNPGPGSTTYFYTNDQSARLLFYHDHSYGTTRLNVYAGEAAGYLIWDQAEEDLISGTNVTGINPGLKKVLPDLGGVYHYGVPLIIQDKTFLPSQTPLAAGQKFSTVDPTWGTGPGGQLAAQDPTWDTGKWASAIGSLWFTHVYTPNQNPSDPGGANAFGRWDYGPWFWPPLTATAGLRHGEVMGTGTNGCAVGVRCLGLLVDPASPTPQAFPSLTPESFMDTPIVNGTPYPYMSVDRRPYRLRILNAANDRSLNLQIYYADPANPTEVKMVPAVPTANFPATWPTDGREGGVPDPTTAGPPLIQIGTESGFLPNPVVIPATPIGYEYDRRSITVLNVSTHALLIGPAERADVIVDFSQVPPGSRLILYNDAPAPNPGFDPRLDYFTGDSDRTAVGGAPTTVPGYGPNTRTIMQFQVSSAAPTAPFDLVALQSILPAAFDYDQPTPIVPETTNAGVAADTYARIQDATVTVGLGTRTSGGVTYPLQPKAIQELFELNYGRMNATLGVELPLTNFNTQTTIPLGYVDPITEVVTNGAPQLWKITHNGVDTHFVHFHLSDVQVLNRIGWDGVVKPPDLNEVGWKDTVRMNPLEDIVVAIRPTVATNLPSTWPLTANGTRVPSTERIVDPTSPPGSNLSLIDPATGNAISIVNGSLVDLAVQQGLLPVDPTTKQPHPAWEYVWHCHILGHEENDMMRPVIFDATPPPPSPVISSISPRTGADTGGTLLTILGSLFPANAEVWVGGVPATAVTVNPAGNRITARTPANPAGLIADVVVATPGNVLAPEMQGLIPTSGAGAVTMSNAFSYTAAVTVTSLLPTMGPTAGGTPVTIAGTNFIPAMTTVTFGGTQATSVAVTSSTSMSAVTPAGTAGPVNVVVNNGTNSVTLTNGFTYVAPPTITVVTPGTGQTPGGTVIVVNGTNFVPGNTTVMIGATAATSVTVTGSTSLTAITPPGPIGPAAVAVTTPGGTASMAGGFTYYAPPATTGVNPSSGPVTGGTPITITALGTSFVAGNTTVTIGGVPATAVTVLSATALTCVTPAGIAGSQPIVVTVTPGPSVELTGLGFTYLALPTITNITPPLGPTAGGVLVTIAGTNFVPANTVVTFNGAASPLVSVTNLNALTAMLPPGTIGAAVVTVTTAGGGGTAPANAFTYSALPAVSAIGPTMGPLAGGTPVTITGANFVAGTTSVAIGGAAATGVTVASSTSLTAVTPAGVAGVAPVSVTTPAGTGTLPASGFTYLPVPTVTAVSATSGPTGGGTTITITGTDFVPGATTVTVAGVASTMVQVSSATSLTLVTPPGPAAGGAAPIVVTTPGGSVTYTGFSYLAGAASIANVTPVRGRTGGGTLITITGNNFFAGSTVTVGGVAATSVTLLNQTTITAVTPRGTAGAVPIVVTTAVGPATSPVPFTYLAPTLDLNGDGIPDVFAVDTTSGASSTLFGDGAGNFAVTSSAQAAGFVPTMGDFNGDGNADVLWYNPSTGAWAEAINDGTGHFTNYTGTWATGGIVTVVDFNGDGKSDAFLYNATTGVWAAALTTGLGTFSLSSGTIAAGYQAFAGDFNGDGKGDVFLYNAATGTWTEGITSTPGSFTFTVAPARQRSNPMSWTGWQVTVLDFNGDHKSDIFLYNVSNGTWAECLNDGTGAFTTQAGQWASGWQLYKADLNADGVDDMLAYNATTGAWAEYSRVSAGVYQSYSGTWTPGLVLTVADIDGDGCADALLYNTTTGMYLGERNTAIGSFNAVSGFLPTGLTLFGTR